MDCIFTYDTFNVKVEEDIEKLKYDYISWGFHAIVIREAWKKAKGEGIKVAVLDTGVDYNHKDLKNRIIKVRDFTNSSPLDRNGHGTNVAGIIAAEENKQGVIGIAPKTDLYIAKVLRDNGNGSYQSIIDAIHWAIEENVDVINMSFGTTQKPPESFYQAIKKAYDSNIVMVAATGNDNHHVAYPAKYDEVIGVSAIDRTYTKAEFSNFGSENCITAPGVEILSTYKDNKYARMSGTSMATPIVSGAISLYLSLLKKNGIKKPSVPEIKKHVLSATVDLGKEGKDEEYGYGMINMAKLMQYS